MCNYNMSPLSNRHHKQRLNSEPSMLQHGLVLLELQNYINRQQKVVIPEGGWTRTTRRLSVGSQTALSSPQSWKGSSPTQCPGGWGGRLGKWIQVDLWGEETQPDYCPTLMLQGGRMGHAFVFSLESPPLHLPHPLWLLPATTACYCRSGMMLDLECMCVQLLGHTANVFPGTCK